MGWCAATAPGQERAKQDRAVEAANAKARVTGVASHDRAADQRLTDLKINHRLEPAAASRLVAAEVDILP